MEEVFLKSALPAQGSFVVDDTSLALPAEPRASKLDSNERSLRVQQQVRLTLARKSKKNLSHGGGPARSTDVSDGFLTNVKVNRSVFSSHSFSGNHVRRPSRRLEISPQASPELPRGRFNYSTYHFGMHVKPEPNHSHIVNTVPYRSAKSDSFRRYAFSESPCSTQTYTSTPAERSFYQRSLRQSVGPQSAFESPAFQQNGEYGFQWGYKQNSAKQERPTVQRLNGDVTIDSVQPDEGLFWLAQVRKRDQRSLKQNSYPPSVTSLEVDTGGQVEIQHPIQQIQMQNLTTLKSKNKPQMTLERAVNLLTHNEEEAVISGVSYIQNQCFKSADAKKRMYFLHGIEKLLQLLNNDSEEVQRVTAGALRNVVYQNNENKMQVEENGGLDIILSTLNNSHDTETRRQLTGLLWNLSSHDLVKERLPKNALTILTRSVLVPSSGISEGENPKDELLADADTFYNATGCLRNLSSAGPDVRKGMRECENLLDSLVYYIRGTVANRKTDDKSTENCACILHNLSYEIESELPQNYNQVLRGSHQDLGSEPKTYGCFSYRSAKIAEHLEHQQPLLEEKANPHGIEWLWNHITVRMYLSLVACSKQDSTQKAAIGALQNITAVNGAISEAIAVTIVQRENGLQHIKKILEEGEINVRSSAIFLLKNLSRYQALHPPIVNQVLPEVMGMLPNDRSTTDQPVKVTTFLCQILTNLSQSDVKNVKDIIDQRGLPKIINISNTDNGYGPDRASKAACVLLHTIWKHTELHGTFRENGFKKSDFINAKTTKSVNSQ